MQIKKECINCTKSSYCGKNSANELLFGCKNPICILEEVISNPTRDLFIAVLQQNSTYKEKKCNF